MDYKDSINNKKIHIGLIASCYKDDQYGLIYGFRMHPYNRNDMAKIENKIFYFKKARKLEIEKHTLVSYLSNDYNEFSPKAEYVIPISSLVSQTDQGDTVKRADGNFHNDRVWKLINDGIPYIDYYCHRGFRICYPIVKGGVCRIWEGLFGGNGNYCNKEDAISELFKELRTIEYNSWPSLEDVSKAIAKFQKQVDRINAFEIIDAYQITKTCRYVSRPGKDDHYYEELSPCLPYDDKYLSYLLPTKREMVFYDDNAYPNDGYENSSTILEKETKEARQKAKAEYSKEKHLAFLISDYFENVMRDLNRVKEIKKRIEDKYDVENAKKIIYEFKGEITEHIIESINQYNNSTIV